MTSPCSADDALTKVYCHLDELGLFRDDKDPDFFVPTSPPIWSRGHSKFTNEDVLSSTINSRTIPDTYLRKFLEMRELNLFEMNTTKCFDYVDEGSFGKVYKVPYESSKMLVSYIASMASPLCIVINLFAGCLKTLYSQRRRSTQVMQGEADACRFVSGYIVLIFSRSKSFARPWSRPTFIMNILHAHMGISAKSPRWKT